MSEDLKCLFRLLGVEPGSDDGKYVWNLCSNRWELALRGYKFLRGRLKMKAWTLGQKEPCERTFELPADTIARIRRGVEARRLE